MSVTLDRQIARARLTPANEPVPTAVPAHPAAVGTPNRLHVRAAAGRAENFARCVSAYRTARLQGVNR